MSELSLQRDVIDSIEGAGGFARKLSHRFAVGVPDLYVKLLGVPGAFIEVKKTLRPKLAEQVLLDLTVPQRRFLMAAHMAGDNAFVLSLLTAPNKLWAEMWRIDVFPKDCRVRVDYHAPVLHRASELARRIESEIREW